MTKALSAVVGFFLLACSGVVRPAAPPPSAAAPAVLLTEQKADDGTCQLVFERLPDLASTVVGSVPCTVVEVVLDPQGRRAWVGGTVVDLATGEAQLAAEMPRRRELVSRRYHFDVNGQPIIVASWGRGEEVFEEGSSWTESE